MTTPPTVGKMSEIAPYLDTIASGMAIGSRLIADLQDDLDTIASRMANGSRLIAILRDNPSVVHAFDSVIRDLFHRCMIKFVPVLTAALQQKTAYLDINVQQLSTMEETQSTTQEVTQKVKTKQPATKRLPLDVFRQKDATVKKGRKT